MTQPRDFWSQRRAAVQAEQQAEALAAAEQKAKADQIASHDREDAEILTELNLPDPDDLLIGDDIRGFMSKAVPERLRRRALRQLWRLNPVLANVDGLVDYGEDFTDSATVLENLQTTYQVGKGMLAHVEELARQQEESESEALVAADDTEMPEPAVAAVEPAPEPQASPDPAPLPTELAFEPETEEAAPLPRRMRFDFATDTASDNQRI